MKRLGCYLADVASAAEDRKLDVIWVRVGKSVCRRPKRTYLKAQRLIDCAIVGNSMNLFDAENGDAIDQYDAVFRFNSEWRRMHHVMKEKGVKFEDKRKYMGTKTTFRLVNRKYDEFIEMAAMSV